MRFYALLLIGLFLSAPAHSALTDGLISYWTLDDDDTSGATMEDVHGDPANDGTIDGATPGGDGILGESYDFVTNDFVSIDPLVDDVQGLNIGSLSIWVDIDDLNHAEMFFHVGDEGDNGDMTGFYYHNGLGSWHGYCSIGGVEKYNTGFTDAPAGVANEWTHLVFVQNGTELQLYVDGGGPYDVTNAADPSCWFNDITNIDGVSLGRYINSGSGGMFWDGQIDEVGIWDKVLDGDEVDLLYNDGDGLAYPLVVDTCTAPGSGDWEVTCDDNCTWDAPQDVPSDMNLTGAGTLTLSDVFIFTGSSQEISIGSGCTLEIASGGEIK